MKIHFLICYDIRDNFRLSRVLRYMKGKGIHVQYSVFYCLLTSKELLKILDDFVNLIDIKQDDVRIYPLVANFKAIVLGRGDRTPEGIDIFLE